MSCSHDHEALKRDAAAWSRLAYVGMQRVPADEYGPAEAYELRDCSCGSTLAIQIERADDFAAEQTEAA